MLKTKRPVVLLSVLVATALAISCQDPETQALNVFKQQGLVLLRPARDYIKVGGIVVLPAKGLPQYLDPDPRDYISSDPSNYVDFKAVIMGQTKNEQTGIEAAVSGLASVMPLSAKLAYKGGQTVQLSQIDTGGRRIPTSTITALFKKKTGDTLRDLLQPKNKYHVFVIQEVYTGKTITLKTTDNQSLDVSYAGGGTVPDCSASTSGSSADKSGSAGSSASQPNSTDNSTAGGTTPKKTTSATKSKTAPSVGASSGPSASLGVCKSGSFALTLQTQDLIPFAVRLNEIVLNDGELSIKYGAFKFPPNSLGSGEETEKATAVLDPGALKGIKLIKKQP